MELMFPKNDAVKKKISQRNIGVEILRMFLCFRIVLLHYYSSNNEFINSLRRNSFQVGCFFFISFYFLYPIISQRDNKKFILRLERLFIPYVVHPIINWIINNILFFIIKFNRYNKFLTLNDLKKQLIIGRGIYGIAVLWFHFNLIFFTIFFFIISYVMKDYFLLFFQITATISYSLQYSGINFRFFKQYSEDIWRSIGNLLETFPLAISAFSISSIKINQLLVKDREKWLIFCVLFLFIIFKYNIFSIIPGFTSSGIRQIFISFFLFTFFGLLPLEYLNSKILFGIKQITRFTQGIYILHFLFQYYIKIKLDKNGSLIGCIILYIISYLISFIGFNICYKTKLKFLFS